MRARVMVNPITPTGAIKPNLRAKMRNAHLVSMYYFTLL